MTYVTSSLHCSVSKLSENSLYVPFLHLSFNPIQTWQKHLTVTFQLSLKNFAFLTQNMIKYAIVEISTKKKIICDTESIIMWI